MTARHARLLAVAFGPKTMAEACAGLARIRQEADCVELRLDHFEERFDLPLLLRERGDLAVVATLRPPQQGGKSPLPAAERMQVLLRAAELGAEYVDLEYNAVTPQALSALRSAGARVIVSRHDFVSMPVGLASEWWPALAALDADVVKVVGTARSVLECLEVFRAFARADRPTIAIAMGAAGAVTRVLALRSDQCFLTYAALDHGGGTAPGQLTVGEMRNTYGVGRLCQRTRVFGLLGPHAEGARIGEYNAWFAAAEFDGIAVPFVATDDASSVISAYRELPVSGWHIHGGDLQRQALVALDEVSAKAKAQNRVNAVARRGDGALVGDWVESPREQYELWVTSSRS